MEDNNKHVLEGLGYNRVEVLDILGFKACFQIKSRCKVGEESAARLYNRFDKNWETAGLWYKFVDQYYKKLGGSLTEKEVVDGLGFYKDLIKKIS